MSEKYAKLLIDKCLAVKENQPLLITAPIECIEFVRLVAKYAMEKGVRDIHYDFTDEVLKHDTLKYFNKEDLNNSTLFNKSIYDVPNIKLLLNKNMLEEDETHIFIAKDWIYKSNEILVKLI